jgi:methylmalonyl-CoA mutase C-terminal domain/subunit
MRAEETPRGSGGSGARPLRVLLAKPGLDGHDRGIKVILRALRDAGMEVIYTGVRAPPGEIARAALEEDVDAVGVSNLSGAHQTLFPEVAEALREAGVDLRRVVLFGGGIIPAEDQPALLAAGYRALFTPGTPLEEIAGFLRREARPAAGSV